MKQKFITVAVLLCFTALNSCSKKDSATNVIPPTLPVANFTFVGANTFAPTPVTFTNTSSNSTIYLWDFGDNGSSAETNPTHTYSTGGVFTVTLTATGTGGSNTISKTINIGDPITSVKITNVKILDMPFTNVSGSSWDISNGPDLYFFIKNSIGTIIHSSTPVISDVVPAGIPLSWTLGTPLTITSLNSQYTIGISDYDYPDNDDFIGGYNFTMSNYSAAHSEKIILNNNSTVLRIQLTVVWQ